MMLSLDEVNVVSTTNRSYRIHFGKNMLEYFYQKFI